LPAGRMVVCGRAASNGKSERAVRWSQAEEADMFLQEEGRRVQASNQTLRTGVVGRDTNLKVMFDKTTAD
jgi:hypothetical protein